MVVCSFYGGDFNVHVVHFIVPGTTVFNGVTLTQSKANENVEVLKLIFFIHILILILCRDILVRIPFMRTFQNIYFYCSGLSML